MGFVVSGVRVSGVTPELLRAGRVRWRTARLRPQRQSAASGLTGGGSDRSVLTISGDTLERENTSHPPQRVRGFSWRWPVMILALLGLVVLNAATLFSASVHDRLFDGAVKGLNYLGADVAERLVEGSVRSAVARKVDQALASARASNEKLAAGNARLSRQVAEEQARLAAAVAARNADARHAKVVAQSVKARLSRTVVRNQAALPATAVPYVGIGVAVSVTAMDLYDACQTMKDFNTLLVRLGEGEPEPEFCGAKVPTVQEVISGAQSRWRESLQQVAAEAKAAPKTVGAWVPEVRAPSVKEIASSVCPVVRLASLCP